MAANAPAMVMMPMARPYDGRGVDLAHVRKLTNDAMAPEPTKIKPNGTTDSFSARPRNWAFHGKGLPSSNQLAAANDTRRLRKSVTVTDQRKRLRIAAQSNDARDKSDRSRVAGYAPPCMPTATYHHEAATPLSPAELWKLLQMAETWANLGPVEKVWEARHANGHLEGFRWSTSVGHTRYEGMADAKIIEPGVKMTLHLTTKELVGALTAEVAETAGGSDLGVTLAIEARGMLASLFFPAISQAIGSGLSRQVDDFVSALDD